MVWPVRSGRKKNKIRGIRLSSKLLHHARPLIHAICETQPTRYVINWRDCGITINARTMSRVSIRFFQFFLFLFIFFHFSIFFRDHVALAFSPTMYLCFKRTARMLLPLLPLCLFVVFRFDTEFIGYNSLFYTLNGIPFLRNEWNFLYCREWCIFLLLYPLFFKRYVREYRVWNQLIYIFYLEE